MSKTAMSIKACGASYKGNVRGHNEDNIYLDGGYRDNLSADTIMIEGSRSSDPHTYAVFDGLGGEQFGENASLIAAELLKTYEQNCEPGGLDVYKYLMDVDKAIRRQSAELGVRSMGTTAALVYIEGRIANVFNIGDSRVYLFRDDKLIQQSKDHSVVQSMIDLGFVNEEDRYTSSHAGELTQYLGMTSEDEIEPSPDYKRIELTEGDILLLCSDGLNSELGDRKIESLLMRSRDVDPQYIVTDLLMTAREGKCADNVSVIVAKCV